MNVDDPNDPIQDLMKEIQAEETAEAARQAAAPEGEEIVENEELEAAVDGDKDPEAGDEKEVPEQAKGGEDKPDKAKKLVPASRLDEETARRRIAERRAAEVEAQLAKLQKKDDPDTKAEDGEKTPEQLRAEMREQVKREMKVESWIAAGHEQYGEDEFETRSKDLAALGAPEFFLPVLFEALDDNMKRAATAVYLLAEQDPAEVAKVFKLSPIRLATYMQRLVAKRPAKEDGEDDPPRPKKTPAKAPKPLAPVKTGQTVNGYNFTDDMSDEEFSASFSKLMEKRPN